MGSLQTIPTTGLLGEGVAVLPILVARAGYFFFFWLDLGREGLFEGAVPVGSRLVEMVSDFFSF